MPRRYPKYQEGGQVPTDIQRLIKRMMEAKTDRAEEVIPDMASGGIIGLQNGGPPWRKDSLGRERRYRTGEEELSGDAAEWLRNMEMDVLLGRRDRSEHPTIDFSTRRAKHRGTLERIRPRPGDPVGSDEMRYVPRSDGPTIEDLYISALDRDPQMHPDSVMKALLPSDLQEELFPYAKPVWEMRDEGRASGGIIGFQAGGMPPQDHPIGLGRGPGPTEDTTRALMEFAERGGLSEEDKLQMDLGRLREQLESERLRGQPSDTLTWAEVAEKSRNKQLARQKREQEFIMGLINKTRGLLTGSDRRAVASRASGGIIGFQAGGNPYQQQMVQSYVSPEVAQPYANLVSQIGQVGARPYTPYGGQRLAATTGDQALARSAYGAYGRGAGPAGTQQAAGTMGQAGQMIGGAYQGMAGLQPQYAQMAGQFGQAAQGALGQAQQDAAALRGAAGQAQVRGDLAAAGMRQTGAAAQAQQQALGAGQAAQGAAAQAEQQRLGAGQAAAAQAGQQQMAGLGAGMGAAGQAALAAQQRFGAGQQALGAGAAGQAQAREAQAAALGQQAQQAGAAGQAQMAGLSTGAGGLGQDIRSQLAGTGQQAQQTGQVGATDIRQAGLESQQLGQQALQGIRGVGGRAEQAGGTAAERMRQLGGQAPELGKGADMSQYMSQYTQNVTDPQLRQLMEFQKQQAQELGSQAAMAGAGGGYRHGLKELQAQQQASQQAADIIGKGQKEAFDSAVGREREDARRREQAQQTGLSAEQQAAQAQQTGIGAAQQAAAQGFGAAQQGQAARQAAAQQAVQAQQQGLSAQLQAQTAGGSAAQQAMGQQLQAAQQGLAAGQQGRDAQMRALQTGIAAGQYGSDAQMRAQQQAAGMQQAGAGALQQALAGQGALTGQGIGMNMQGLAAQRAAAQAGAGLGAQGLAAQRAAATQGAQLGLQSQQQGFQAGQAGAQLGMSGLQQAGQLGQQGYGTMGRMLGQQQGAIGAQGQAFGQMGQMGAQMGALGGQQQRQAQMEQQLQMQRLQGMEQAGARTQQEQQRDYDIAYQDFQRQQQWPQQQIGWQLGAMRQLPYQNTQVVGDYGQTPSTASDVAGALGAYHDWQSDQTADPAADAAAGDVAPTPDANVPDATGANTAGTANNPIGDPGWGGFDPTAEIDPGAHGGYLSSSGILAPYHKKLIDGLYAGGRINY